MDGKKLNRVLNTWSEENGESLRVRKPKKEKKIFKPKIKKPYNRAKENDWDLEGEEVNYEIS